MLDSHALAYDPFELDLPKDCTPLLLGSEGLIRLASRLDRDRFRVADVTLRDSAWRTSDENSSLKSVSDGIINLLAAPERDTMMKVRTLIGSIVVEAIEWADVKNGRRIRVTRLGIVEIPVPTTNAAAELRDSFLASLNAQAA